MKTKMFNRIGAIVAIILIVLTILSAKSKADYFDYQSEPDYNPYLKVSVGYILNQPTGVSDPVSKRRVHLFEGDHYNYSVEMGISVLKPNSNKEWHFGLAVTDLLNQGESSKYYSPYKVEVFGDHVTNFNHGYYFTLGVGFKIASDNRILLKAHDVNYFDEEEYFSVNDSFIDKITARVSIGKKFKYYSLSLDHHSQYLVGQPFSDNFEYHVTSFNISKTF